MDFEREKVKLLAENLAHFAELVARNERHLAHMSAHDQLYRLKNLVDEFKLSLLASEIERINRFPWEPGMMAVLIERVQGAVKIIDEYIENNREGLFFYSARVHTLKSICSSFTVF